MAFLPLDRRGGGAQNRRMRIEILIYDGFDDLDGFGPFEVFNGAGIETRFVTLAPQEVVTTSHGARVIPHGALGDPDLVLVPGGGWNDGNPQGARAEARRGDIPRALAARHTAGRRVGSVCTGAMLLAEAGILEGRRAITHHSAIEDLRGCGVDVFVGVYANDDVHRPGAPRDRPGARRGDRRARRPRDRVVQRRATMTRRVLTEKGEPSRAP